ncbi:MAG: hypothetical protein FRX49_01240 [Trebouxia sp. A1-2]|nr:MAG: hypothetical protein FRX49_01240 [Trebouxia sp. A1-2]
MLTWAPNSLEHEVQADGSVIPNLHSEGEEGCRQAVITAACCPKQNTIGHCQLTLQASSNLSQSCKQIRGHIQLGCRMVLLKIMPSNFVTIQTYYRTVTIYLKQKLTAIEPARGLGVSHRIVPVALSRAAHNPFSVVLGLPGLGLKTGAGDDLYKAEIPLIVDTTAALTIKMSVGGADLQKRNNVCRKMKSKSVSWGGRGGGLQGGDFAGKNLRVNTSNKVRGAHIDPEKAASEKRILHREHFVFRGHTNEI